MKHLLQLYILILNGKYWVYDNLSLSVTICHYSYQSFTIYYNLSLSVTIWTIFHQKDFIVKNFKTVTKVWHSLTQTDRQTEWLTRPDLERHAPLKIHSLNPLNIMEHVYGHYCTSPRLREPSWTPKWTLKLTLRGWFLGTLANKRPSRVQSCK